MKEAMLPGFRQLGATIYMCRIELSLHDLKQLLQWPYPSTIQWRMRKLVFEGQIIIVVIVIDGSLGLKYQILSFCETISLDEIRKLECLP